MKFPEHARNWSADLLVDISGSGALVGEGDAGREVDTPCLVRSVPQAPCLHGRHWSVDLLVDISGNAAVVGEGDVDREVDTPSPSNCLPLAFRSAPHFQEQAPQEALP